MNDDKRIDYIDYLNVFCCIAVIALHCNGCFWSFSYERYWITSVFIECIFYFAVPIFFMITGVTLFDYKDKYDTKTYFIKRLKRTVIPFLFWSVAWVIFSKTNRDKSIIEIFDLIINTKAQGVYWFFIPLFSIYLSIPAFSYTTKEQRIKILKYILYYGLITVSIVPLIINITKLPFNYGLTAPVCGGFLIYPVIGYLLVNSFKFNGKQRVAIYILGFCGLISRILTVLFWSLEEGKIINTFWGVMLLPTVAYSIAVFVFFQYDIFKFKLSSLLKKVNVKEITNYTFGIYLVHMIFVIKLPQILHFSNHSIIWRSVGVLFVFLLSLLAVKILKRIPLLKKIV